MLARTYLGLLALYLVLRLSVGDAFWGVSLLNTFVPYWFLPLPFVLVIVGAKRLWLSFALVLGLSLVAGVWFGTAFLPRAIPAAEGQTLKVVSYNMHALPEGLEPWLLELQPDFVLLQEVPQTYSARAAKTLAELYPFQQN